MASTGTTTRTTADPTDALHRLGPFLDAQPVTNNVIRTLLEGRVGAGGDCACTWVEADGRPIGAAYRWPPNMPVQVSTMADEAIEPIARDLAATVPAVDAIAGPVPEVAKVAGAFATITRRGGAPEEAMRLYEVDAVVPARARDGNVRRATVDDADLLAGWMDAFDADTGAIAPGGEDAGARVRGFLTAGSLHVWEAGGRALGCAVARPSDSGVVRIGFVYTPPAHRGSGVAESLVAALSADVLAAGNRCMLLTQLANPVSNAVYQRIGYRPVGELLRYRFDPPEAP